MIFVMDDGSLVFTSEKVGRHLQFDNEQRRWDESWGYAPIKRVESWYKCGPCNRQLGAALNEIPDSVPISDFGPLQKFLYAIVM